MLFRWLMVLRGVFRNWPVTAMVIAVAVVLHIGVSLYPQLYPDDAREAHRRLGAATTIEIYLQPSPDAQRKQIPKLYGPFDLWDGQLWRVAVNGFHHGNVLHLVLNCMAIASMGSLLEPRVGRLKFAVFLLTATTISTVTESLLLNTAIGLSGGAYAMFGLLLVLRRHDTLIAEIVPPSFAVFGFAWLFLCMGLTFFDILPIANAAHVAGVIYGLLAGQVFYGRPTTHRFWKLGFFASHLLLIPAFYLIMHPFWIGNYYWYRAESEEDPQRRALYLERAVSRDPSLEIPWSKLASYYVATGERQRGWTTILRGLDYNRSDASGVRVAQQIWLRFNTAYERWEALGTLRKIFGDESRDWCRRLKIMPSKVLIDLVISEENPQRRTAILKQAIDHDPSLTIPWGKLAGYYVTTGNRQRGWMTILRGLEYNRSDSSGARVAQHIWLTFKTPDERWEALEALQKVFGDESRNWWRRLRIVPNRISLTGVPIGLDLGLPQPNASKLRNEAEGACLTLFMNASGQPMARQNLTAPAIDPDAPGSAAEGVTF